MIQSSNVAGGDLSAPTLVATLGSPGTWRGGEVPERCCRNLHALSKPVAEVVGDWLLRWANILSVRTSRWS